MKPGLTKPLAALESSDTGLPVLAAVHHRRFTTLNTTSGPVFGTDDMTHAWDGWLFAILTLGAVWPIVYALGSLN